MSYIRPYELKRRYDPWCAAAMGYEPPIKVPRLEAMQPNLQTAQQVLMSAEAPGTSTAHSTPMAVQAQEQDVATFYEFAQPMQASEVQAKIKPTTLAQMACVIVIDRMGEDGPEYYGMNEDTWDEVEMDLRKSFKPKGLDLYDKNALEILHYMGAYMNSSNALLAKMQAELENIKLFPSASTDELKCKYESLMERILTNYGTSATPHIAFIIQAFEALYAIAIEAMQNHEYERIKDFLRWFDLPVLETWLQQNGGWDKMITDLHIAMVSNTMPQ